MHGRHCGHLNSSTSTMMHQQVTWINYDIKRVDVFMRTRVMSLKLSCWTTLKVYRSGMPMRIWGLKTLSWQLTYNKSSETREFNIWNHPWVWMMCSIWWAKFYEVMMTWHLWLLWCVLDGNSIRKCHQLSSIVSRCGRQAAFHKQTGIKTYCRLYVSFVEFR